MGLELGCRAMDKCDILLIPFVLLLQMSLLFFALLFPALCLLLWLYDSCFNQAISHSLQSELLRSLVYVAYLLLCLVMRVIYWLHKILGWILAPVYHFWMVIFFAAILLASLLSECQRLFGLVHSHQSRGSVLHFSQVEESQS